MTHPYYSGKPSFQQLDEQATLRSDFWSLQEKHEKLEAKLERVRDLEKTLRETNSDLSLFFAALLRTALQD